MTSSLEKENYGGRRYLPYVFTEQGLQGKKENESTKKIFPQKTNKKFSKTIAQ